MNKHELINEIITALIYFKVIEKDIDKNLIEKNIIDNLDNITFIETLLSVLFQKMNEKRFKYTLDKKRLTKLLIEVEKIRLDLEFKDI